jgi:hypothetical protein
MRNGAFIGRTTDDDAAPQQIPDWLGDLQNLLYVCLTKPKHFL